MIRCGPEARRAGFVLVGGNSSRMGCDKALLPYGAATLAEHVAAQVQAAAGSVVLVGDPERYGCLAYPSISDLHHGRGPLAGIEAALAASRSRWNLIAACDMPLVTAEFLGSLLDRAEAGGGPCLAPVSPGGRLEPLCAVWRRDCLAAIRQLLRMEAAKMTDALQVVGAVRWPVAESACFENLNTPGDWDDHCRAFPPAAHTA